MTKVYLHGNSIPLLFDIYILDSYRHYLWISTDSIEQQIWIAKLQRQKLKLQADWEGFLHSEWKQLNWYNEVGMFGDPVQRTIDMVILPWVWTYMYKDTEGEINKDATKSRGTCNSGPRYCNKSSISETYAACVEQPIHWLTWAISTALGLTCKGYDVGNAFAEALAPKFSFYMQPDAQFRQWWRDCLKRPELAPDDVIPIQHALQGHPESPRLWDKYITNMLTDKKFGFKTCTHEPCLYYKIDKNNNLMLIVHQVDDLLCCHVDPNGCDEMAKMIQKELTFPLNFLGTVRKFNGVNVDQTKHYHSNGLG